MEDFIEYEFGQGQQTHDLEIKVILMTNWTWDDNGYNWQSRANKGRQLTRKVARKGEGRFKRNERALLVESKLKTPSCGLKKIVLGGPKENEARKAFQKSNEGVWRCGCRTFHPEKGSSNDFNPRKSRRQGPKKQGQKVLILTQDFQPLKHQMKEYKAITENEFGIPT